MMSVFLSIVGVIAVSVDIFLVVAMGNDLNDITLGLVATLFLMGMCCFGMATILDRLRDQEDKRRQEFAILQKEHDRLLRAMIKMQGSEESIYTTENPSSSGQGIHEFVEYADGSWRCTCGRRNGRISVTCACGISKRYLK